MEGGFNPEAFKAHLKEEVFAETRSMMRKMMGEITKLIKENQLVPLTGLIDLDTEILVRNRKEDDVMVLADPVGQRNVGQVEEEEQSDWARNMTKAMAQM